MSVRLNKICKELNVGLQTIIDFLERNGYTDEWSPLSKIEDDQYEMVVKHFGTETRMLALPWKEDSFTSDPVTNREIINSHGWNRMRGDTIMILPSRFILIPKNQNLDRIAYWTKSDFENKCQNAFEGGKIIKERLSRPSGYIPVTSYVEPQKTIETESAPEVFKLKHSSSVVKPSVLGVIDITALDQSTRPKKKSKEERIKERNERNSWRQEREQFKKQTKPIVSNIAQNSIRNIWQRFVDIQEKLIKQRCSPITIIPDSIDVDNDKLYVTVDESRNEQQLNSLLEGKLGLDSYDLESGYILVDESKWNSLTETDLEQVRKGLSECYVELDTTPSINVTINYGGGMDRCDQLSIDELRKLDLILKNGNLIEGTINDSAAFISKVNVDREGYMKYLFGDHYVTYEKKKKNQQEPKIVELFEYHNQYIPWDVMKQYAHLGLNCKHYTLIFKINNPKANEVLKDCYDCYYPNKDTFEFCRDFTKKNPCHKDYVAEANNNINAFMDEAMIYCSKYDIEMEVVFVYTISKHQLIKAKFVEVGQYIRNKGEGYSFNYETGAIGIDFNWRTDNIVEILSDIEREIPFVKVNIHEDHRFKCSVKSQIVGYDVLKKTLEDKYDDIDIQNDSVFHQIKIRLPYLEAEFYEIKRASLESDLLQLSVSGIEVQFAEKIPGKIRLNVIYNKNSRLEDLEESINEMRRADFGFMLGDKEVLFGKLLKANYPHLVFDIDVDDEKKNQIIEAFESKAVTTIIPILTGDLEKISRLKNTFTKATTGAELVNPRLQRFIFNSAEATKTQDIDLILRKEGSVYKELCEHLLNSRVNESQKNAIIKAMYAEDLAVIQGPPGTGKSTAIAEMIWQLVRKGLQQGNKRERILLTSETNLAVDNAISRIVNDKTNLVKPVRFGGEEKLESEGLQFSIELMKRWVEEGDSCLVESETDEETDTIVQSNLILKNWLDNISARSFYRSDTDGNAVIIRWRNYLENPSRALREIVYNRYIENANVIGATCSSIGDYCCPVKLFQTK